MKLSYPPGNTVDQSIERIVMCLNRINEENLADELDLSEITVIMPATMIGDLIPAVDNAYDIGNSTLEWRNLRIDGKAYIDGFGESTLFDTTYGIQFRDSAIHIESLDDGHLDLTADTSIDMNGAVIGTSTASFTNYTSTVAIGTQPYACTSTTLNNNLNADLLDGYHAITIISLAEEDAISHILMLMGV